MEERHAGMQLLVQVGPEDRGNLPKTQSTPERNVCLHDSEINAVNDG